MMAIPSVTLKRTAPSGVNALPAQVRGQRKNLLVDPLQRPGQSLAPRRQIGPRLGEDDELRRLSRPASVVSLDRPSSGSGRPRARRG